MSDDIGYWHMFQGRARRQLTVQLTSSPVVKPEATFLLSAFTPHSPDGEIVHMFGTRAER